MNKNLLLVSLVAAGVAIGACLAPRQSTAEARRAPPQEAFQSGGERSIAVLKEIVVGLDRVERRLERIESAVRELKAAPNPARLP
jgi:hypothetical protein